MVTRVKQWPKILSQHLEEVAKTPFQWGVNDCMSNVALFFEKMTGQEGRIYSRFAGYQTAEEALDLLDAHGGIIGIINEYAGQNHDKPLRARRGDIVVVYMPDLTAGIVDDTGKRIAIVTDQGLRRFGIRHAVHIWSY